ncbi:MAG TPA: hypothetical protein VFY87_29090, partial [Geminicoccaceae bacterium]|nr:hypothetical protein [Geminicoccaceae bacterium]
YRFALRRLREVVRLWIMGSTLRELELALGTPPRRLGACRNARALALRLMPDLAHGFGLMEQVHRHRLASGAPMPLVIGNPTVGAALSG